MVKAVVLYGRPEDPDAFERYYAETHTALAKAMPGLRDSKPRAALRRRMAAPSLPADGRAHVRGHGRAAGGPRVRGGPGGCERHPELRHRRRDDLLRRDRLTVRTGAGAQVSSGGSAVGPSG